MNRRELLAVGGSGVASSLSGCLSEPLFGHPEVREQSGQAVERAIYTPLSDESADPAFATLAVGERGFHLGERKPHQVWVRNAAGERREVAVGIGGSTDGNPWFRRRYGFDPGARLVIELRTPREYAVSIRAGEREEIVEVSKSRFDCNDSARDVVVREGKIEAMRVTTGQGCGGLW